MAQHITTGNKGTPKYLPPSKGLTKKEKAKAILWLVTELAKYGILQKVMAEFKKQKLDVKYQKEIEEWKKYYREKKFAGKLDQQMLQKIDRYMKGKITTEELIKETFLEPEWIIEDNT